LNVSEKSKKYKKQKLSAEVTQNSFALELDLGVFTWKIPGG